MKTSDLPSKSIIYRSIFLVLLSVVLIVSCYAYRNYIIYSSIKVVTRNNVTVEYGSANYDINNFIKKVDGEIVSIKKDVDLSVIGEQEVVLSVKKNNIIRDVPIVISVVDSMAPLIELKNDVVTIVQGESYDLNENISKVEDLVDGVIEYNSDESQELGYYSIRYDDISDVGNHEITVFAVDSYGNSSSSVFTLEVLKPKPQYYSLPPSAFGNDVVSIAYSLLGRPYYINGNGPDGFDCSGFVQYVYSIIGVSISRSTSTQLYDGLPVSYQDIQPGDIIVWGYGDYNATHSALYVGDGLMIHAANTGTGVILSSVDEWLYGSGTTILSVRRI